MITSTDQTGRIVYSPRAPLRILSLVPSQTELLFYLGLEKRLAGITRFCVHPDPATHSLVKVGGTKKIHHDIIRQLNPDLIIANKEENSREDIESLIRDYPVWISDVQGFDSALDMIHSIGLITSTATKADQLIVEISREFEALEKFVLQSDLRRKKLKTAYLIWEKPLMVVGKDNFIHSMIETCGLINAFDDLPRYPVTSIEEVRARNCNLFILPSEPFPFTQKHVEQYERKLPGAKIVRADGEMFSWYGSRMKLAPSYFISFLRQISS
jgi:ABC-type Fe3+-hydroxamate transport system substrate-binding protein